MAKIVISYRDNVETPEKIIFIDEGHKYVHLPSGSVLTSATTTIGQFFPKFDGEYQCYISAFKEILGEEKFLKLRKEVFGFDYKPDASIAFPFFTGICGTEDVEKVRLQFLDNWNESGPKGTEFHKERELESIERGYEISPFTGREFPVITFDKEHENEVYSMDLFELPDGYYPEVLIYDKALPIEKTVCGQVDKLFIETIDGIRYTSTDDYKTVNKYPEESKYNKCSGIFSHLWANSMTKYSLQGSYYQMMLESHGFVPHSSAFTAYLNYDVNTAKIYQFVIKRKEIELLRKFILEN